MNISDTLTTFSSDEFGQIRLVQGEDGEPRFCLADICKALGLQPRHTANDGTRMTMEIRLRIRPQGRIAQTARVYIDIHGNCNIVNYSPNCTFIEHQLPNTPTYGNK